MVAEIWASVMSSFVDQLVALRQGTLGRTWVSGPAHKFSVFGPTVMYYI